MAAEPVTIFSHKLDPAGVVEAVRRVAPDMQLVGDGAAWEQIIVPGRKRLMRRSPPLVINHDAEYYAEPNWLQQVVGMTRYFASWPRNARTPEVMSLIPALRFAVSVGPDCPIDLDFVKNDPWAGVIRAIARELDGIIFTPSTLRDANGWVIISADGRADTAAKVPRAPEVSDDDDEPLPPAPERVAKRALALAAVAGRALLEQEDPRDPGVEQTRQRILAWVNEVGLGDELEPNEWKPLQSKVTAPSERDVVNGTWRLEGLAVLAWALNRFALPPHDEPVDPGKLLPAVGILNADRAKALVSEPPVRSREELLDMQTRLLALNWRMVEFRLRRSPVNFHDFCDGRTPWLGKVDLRGVALIDNDLALRGDPIASAPTDIVNGAQSIALERHLAINWLCDGGAVYSETDTST